MERCFYYSKPNININLALKLTNNHVIIKQDCLPKETHDLKIHLVMTHTEWIDILQVENIHEITFSEPITLKALIFFQKCQNVKKVTICKPGSGISSSESVIEFVNLVGINPYLEGYEYL